MSDLVRNYTAAVKSFADLSAANAEAGAKFFELYVRSLGDHSRYTLDKCFELAVSNVGAVLLNRNLAPSDKLSRDESRTHPNVNEALAAARSQLNLQKQ